MEKKKINSNTFLLIITIVLFVVMYVAGMIIFSEQGFAKPQMFLNLFISNAGLIVIGCGMTLVMITGGIDISVGSVTALVCMVSAYVMENKGMSAWMAVFFSLIIGICFGLVQGYLVTYLEIQPFIVTLAGIALIVVIIISVMLKYSKFGRKLYAIGGNQQSAVMMGLNVKRTKMQAYVLDGFLAGLGGFLFCLNSCAGFVEQAKGLEMDAISSAVIGGTLLSGGVGTVIGTLFGVLIKGTITSLITTQGTLSSWWVRITLSALLCFFIVLQAVFAAAKKKNKN